MLKQIIKKLIMKDYEFNTKTSYLSKDFNIKYDDENYNLDIVYKLFDNKKISSMINNIVNVVDDKFIINNKIIDILINNNSKERKSLNHIYFLLLNNGYLDDLLKAVPEFYIFFVVSNGDNINYIHEDYINDELIMIALESDCSSEIIENLKDKSYENLMKACMLNNEILSYFSMKELIKASMNEYIQHAKDYILNEESFLKIINEKNKYSNIIFEKIYTSEYCIKHNKLFNDYVRENIINIDNITRFDKKSLFKILDHENRISLFFNTKYIKYFDINTLDQNECVRFIEICYLDNTNINIIRTIFNKIINKTDTIIITYINKFKDSEYIMNFISNEKKIEYYLGNNINDYRFFKYIENPNEEVCIKGMNINPNIFEYIKNPSIDLQKLAIKLNRTNINYIENHTLELYNYFLDLYPNNTFTIKNKKHELYLLSKNYNFYKNMYEYNNEVLYVALSIKDLKINSDNFKTKTFLELITTNEKYIRQFIYILEVIFGNPSLIEYVNIMSDIIHESIELEKIIFKTKTRLYRKYKYQTNELDDYVISLDINNIVNIKEPNMDYIIKALKDNIYNIKTIYQKNIFVELVKSNRYDEI